MLTDQAEQLARLRGALGGKPAEGLSLLGRLRRALGFGAPKVMPGVEEDEGPRYIAGLAGEEPDVFAPGSGGRSNRRKEKTRRKQANASRRRNRR